MSTMSTTTSLSSLLLLLLLTIHRPATTTTATATATATTPNPYFSKSTFSDHQKMLTTFKIFIYPNYPSDLTQTLPPPLSLFFSTLLTSRFITHDPAQAHLFLLPFETRSSRSLSGLIQTIRTSYPYWDRSLGADHFYLTCHEMGPPPNRNVVELRKNAVQVSCFPAPAREFVPHKDLTLPPIFYLPRAEMSENHAPLTRYLGYMGSDQVRSSSQLIIELRNDPEFLVKSEGSDDVEGIQKSEFCLFAYDVASGLRGLGVALVQGCVPVVIADRPIQEFPLMDVIRWSEIVLFVGSNVGVEEFKSLLKKTRGEGGEYESRRRLGVAVARHLMWNTEGEEDEAAAEPFDAFHMVMYELWLRRHVVRYARFEDESASL